MTNSVTPAELAGRKLSLWFFRDLTGEQRGKLFSLFGMTDAMKDINHAYQAMALAQVVRALSGTPAPQTNLTGSEDAPLTVSFPVHEIAHNLLLAHTGSEGGTPTIDWYRLRSEISDAIAVALENQRKLDTPPERHVEEPYLVWSNEYKCWWGPNRAGYVGRLADAGRYTRQEAIKICVNARGGRRFNSNPSEVPLPLADAELFWPDDKEEWRIARFKHDHPEHWEDEE